jgi:hypothetical protein
MQRWYSVHGYGSPTVHRGRSGGGHKLSLRDLELDTPPCVLRSAGAGWKC